MKKISKRERILIGDIDTSQLLPFGDEEEAISKVKEAIDDASCGVGFILASSLEIHDKCKLENIIAMLKTAWSYGIYQNQF